MKNVEDVYPLSPTQQGLLFHSLYEPGSGAYVEQVGWTLAGAFDESAFARAWRQVVARHAPLRTCFFWEGLKQPLQVVRREVEAAWERHDWRGGGQNADATARGRRLRAFLEADRRRGFTLTKAPLTRLSHILLGDDARQFVWTYHHLLLDGWSVSLVLDELFRLYGALAAGLPAPPAAERPRPFRDYIAWLQGQDAAEAEAFWRERLRGFVAPTPLGAEVVSAAAGGASYRTHEKRLSRAATESLREFARRRQLTLSTLVEGAWALLLSRYGGAREVVFGTVVSGRPPTLPGVETMVGLFVNTLPARVAVAPDARAAGWLAELQRRQFAARRYEYSPLAEIREWCEVPAGQPLFRSLVVFDNAPETRAPNVAGADIRDVFRADTNTGYPLALGAVAGRELTLRLTCEEGRFADAAGARMLAHLENLLTALADDADERLADLRMLSAGERRQLLAGWNETAVSHPERAAFPRLFEARAAARPEAVAVSAGDVRLTYGELNARADALARRLVSLGVGPEVLVGVCCGRSAEMVVALLGVWKAGGAYVPLDPSYPAERLRLVLEDSRARVLLVEDSLRGVLPKCDARIIDIGGGEPAPGAYAGASFVEVTPGNLAYVIYTSGSTGRPKGVMIEHRALVNFLSAMRECPGLDERDVLLAVTSLSFDIAGLELFLPLLVGARLEVASREATLDGETLKDVLAASGATVMQATPSTWLLLSEAGWGGRDGVTALCGGEALPRELAGRLRERAAALWNMYGPTETTIWSLLSKVAAGGGPVKIGRPIDNTQAYVLDGQLQPVPVGVPGELYLGGAGLSRGYLGAPGLTAEKFSPDPFGGEPGARLYRTGDLTRRLEDGEIEFLGRLDQQVKLRGHRIELGEIETRLGQHPSVREAVAVVRAEPTRGERLVAYLTAAPGHAPQPGELRRFLKERLPPFMLPSAFVVLEEMPLTPNGKLDRRRLPAPGASRPESEEGLTAPRNRTEEALAGVWAEVLGVERVGVHDNFFELGGDSILSVQIVFRARQAGLSLAPKDLFAHQTIAELASVASPADAAPPAPAEDFPPARLTQRQLDELARGGRIEDAYALSPMQEGMLFHALRAPGTEVYCEQMSFQLRGELDAAAFERAWREMCKRHAVLRTAFVWKSLDEPLQVVHESVRLPLDRLDWRGLAADEQARRLAAFRRADLARGFDFSDPPLMRLTLIRTDEQTHELVWGYHHLLLDGWSVPLLFGEVLEVYEALTQGRVLPLPARRPYRDYIAWLGRQDLRRAEAFWRDALGGVTAPTPLARASAATRAASPGAGEDYGRQQILLPRALGDALRGLAREHRLTLNTLAQGAWALLLARYGGVRDVIFGATVSGRPAELAGADEMIGLFINTLPVRVRVDGGEQVLAWLKGLQERQAEASPYVHSPLAEVQSWSDVPRGVPLFESILVFENYPFDESLAQASGSLEIGAARNTEGTDYPLTLVVTPGEELSVRLLYDRRRFDPATAARMLAHFRRLLEGLAADAGRNLSRLPLLSEAETHAALVEWNDTRAEYPSAACFHHLVEEQARRTPDALAVSCAGWQLSYAELNTRANRLAHHLRGQGVGPEVRVGVMLERSPELVVARLAVLKAGGAYVSLDPGHPAARLSFMLEDARAPVLLARRDAAGRLPSRRARVVCPDADRELIEQESGENPDAPVGPRNLAYVYYTSGSTGQPKGVETEHAGLVNLVTWHNRAYGVTPADRKSQISGLAFDASVWELWPYLAAGASVHLPDEETRASWPKLLAWMVAEAITVCFLPTPLAEAVMDDEWPDGLRLRALLTGGDKLRRWPRRPPPFSFVNKYGPTEVSAVTTWAPMGADAERDAPPPIGRPIANTRTYVLDRHLNLAPVGAPGELYIGGVGLARGYLRRPGLTAERFIPDPFSAEPGARLYKTGDLVSYLPDGQLDFLGRIDQQVKVRGYRIELGEIEAALCEHAAVREAVVLAREDLPGAKQLVAYLVPSPESAAAATGEPAPTAEELRRFLKERLPEHMVPSVFVLLDSLPLTPNGKLDRRALPAPRQGQSSAPPYVAPRNSTEEALAGVWAEVLGVERVGVHDNFFELGGDSILSIRIIARAGRRGIEISPNQLFLHPTVGELAEQCAPPAGHDPRAESTHEKLPPRPTPPPGARTLADFPDADLSQRELDLLLTRLAGADHAD